MEIRGSGVFFEVMVEGGNYDGVEDEVGIIGILLVY